MILSPFVGEPRECTGYLAIPPCCGPREGKGKVATSVFVSHCWGPLRMQEFCSNSALFWAPEKVGGREPLLTLSPLGLEIFENAGAM